MDFFTAFLVEKSLSVDNLFVFLMIFEYFKVPQAHTQRVLGRGGRAVLLLTRVAAARVLTAGEAKAGEAMEVDVVVASEFGDFVSRCRRKGGAKIASIGPAGVAGAGGGIKSTSTFQRQE